MRGSTLDDQQLPLQGWMHPDDVTAAHARLAVAVASVEGDDATEAPRPHATEAAGWLELALEAALREDPAGAQYCAEQGLAAPGGQAPNFRLALLRCLAIALELRGDTSAVTAAIARRTTLLRALGRPRQARFEEQLGAVLLREPDHFETRILHGVIEDERRHVQIAGELEDTVLAEALVAAAVAHLDRRERDDALPLAEEAVQLLRRQRRRGLVIPFGAWSAAHLLLARLRLASDDVAGADRAAAVVTSRPSARAVYASAQLVRGIVNHRQGQRSQSLERALEAAEQLTEARLRRGAASAAALVARQCDLELDDLPWIHPYWKTQAERTEHEAMLQETAILAWRLAAAQAERAEAPEAGSMAYCLGHQLLEAGRHEEAHEVLDAVVLRAQVSGHPFDVARARMDRAETHMEGERVDSAAEDWLCAAEIFADHDEFEEVHHAVLSITSISVRLEAVVGTDLPAVMDRVVAVAERIPNPHALALIASLHWRGIVRCQNDNADGVADLERGIAVAMEHDFSWHAADLRNSLARCLGQMGRTANAVTEALRSADAFHDVNDTESADHADLFAATLCLEAHARQEADARQEAACTAPSAMLEQAAALFNLLADRLEPTSPVLGPALEGLKDALTALGDDGGAAAAQWRLDGLESSGPA
ncbi:MAG: hypothetical protein Q4G34_02260 [Micrococcus sp.]|nr:hypothetical protein [Micrococcus sp.]